MRLLLAIIVLLCAVPSGAQQVGRNASLTPKDSTTFQAGAQLVIETVVVKDKNAKSIEGLAAQDFTVTEDGAPQTIRFFEFQKLAEVASAAAASPSHTPRPEPFK